MSLAVFLLACHRATTVFAKSRLFEGIRSFLSQRFPTVGHWARCPMCLGVPVGIAWSALGLRLGASPSLPADLAVAGAVSSGECWICHVALHALGEQDL